jgi:hypothetical protein
MRTRRTDPRLERFQQAYLQMAHQAKYRPQALSDGCGTIQLELAELRDPHRLQVEAGQYALQFSAEEDHNSFWIGCSDFRTNKAFVWTIEAARLLASGVEDKGTALKLLRLVAAEVARVMTQSSRSRQT